MISELIAAFVEGTPFDSQQQCIEIFFDNEFWVQAGFPSDEGTDEETLAKIAYILANRKDYDLPLHIIEMLEFWAVEGF